MTRSKNHKQDEDLQGIIKSLKREIKSLNQEIARLHKLLGYGQNKTEKTKRVKDFDNVCPECQKGIIKVSDLGIRKIVSCPFCTYKKITK